MPATIAALNDADALWVLLHFISKSVRLHGDDVMLEWIKHLKKSLLAFTYSR